MRFCLFLIGLSFACKVLSQAKLPITQQGGNCTVNTIGDNNTIASLTCNNLDPKLAGQLLALVNAARRNEKSSKDILEKLDLVLREVRTATEAHRITELRMADRRLASEQRSRITNAICNFGGRNVDIGLYNADGEMQTLAKELSEALPIVACGNRLGWEVSIKPFQVTEGFSGIQIVVHKAATSADRLFAKAIVDALVAEGLRVDGPMPEPKRGSRIGGGGSLRQFDKRLGIPDASVEIAIGRKP